MSKAQSRSASQIITAFTAVSQEMQLNVAKQQFDKLTNELKQRRKDIINKNGGGVADKAKGGPVDASKAEKFKSMDEHRIDLKELEERMETSATKGMTQAVGERKLKDYGPNQLSEKKKQFWLISLLHEFVGFFGLLLSLGGALCFLAYGLSPADPSTLYLGIILFLVNFATGTMTFVQNSKSEALMEAFKNFIPPETQVIRDGQQRKISAVELVPGDLIVIEFGKRIPADVRIVESQDMKVDNSSLTGESLLLLRTPECTKPDNPLETKNLAFFGTLCKEGSGKGIVVFTGDNTVIGQIAGLASSAEAGESPLRQELNRFITIILSIAVFVGVIFFCLGFIVGYDAITNLLFAVGIIVGFVPEGLQATVTVGLTLTAKKLASRKVLVKNLEGVETLGSASCICSDKTGTLTQNKMTVEHLWFNNKKIRGHNREKHGPRFPYEYSLDDEGFKILHDCAVVCSEAVFDSSLPQDMVMKIQNNATLTQEQKDAKMKQAKKDWQITLNKIMWLDKPVSGDASETALVKFYQPINDILDTRSRYNIIKDSEGKQGRMPFNSTNKYAFLIVQNETPDSYYTLFTKGAPERIWALCDTVYMNGQPVPKDEQWEKSYEEVNLSFGKQGERVLGFAKCVLPKDKFPKNYSFNLNNMNFPFNNQTFCGLISLVDPPKDAVPNAVIKCKTAGIQVIMVTGDQPVTACAIARQCNIILDKTANELSEETGISFEDACKQSKAVVIHGDRLTKMAIDDEGLPESEKGRALSEWVSKPQVVFARTSPAQKLIIVSACQKLGHIVAVTGDGVNDSPAIKKADIGVSMGITGSDVAKDAADMILLDDDFSSIVVGIEEGRKIFDNIKKVIGFIAISNAAEWYPFLGLMIFQFPLPLTTVLILIIDLGSNLVASTAMVFEEPEVDIMTRNPRRPDEHLTSNQLLVYGYVQFGVVHATTGFIQWFIVLNDFGFPPSELFGLVLKFGVAPEDTDYYDPNSPWLGNSNLNKPDFWDSKNDRCVDPGDSSKIQIDWLYTVNANQDLRQVLVMCDPQTGRWTEQIEWGKCHVNQISPVTNRPVCWTTEANKYGQASFYFALVIDQIAVYFACQTIKGTILYQGVGNFCMWFGFFVNFWILASLSYFSSLYPAFGTRDLIFQHFGICAIPFSIYILLWAEIRRYLIRNTTPPKQGMPNWWFRCICQ